MDSLTFETYSSYSDASTPRTPSPSEMLQYHKIYDDSFNKRSLLNELYEPSDYFHQQHSDWLNHPAEFPIMRRATFPYVRHDRDDIPLQHYPPFIQQHQQQHYQVGSSPHSSYHDFEDPNVKLEDTTMLQQSNFYRSPSNPMPMPYLPTHNSLAVQHTDDAASKETQYLRRRCFNCHTTEPPSWRRSTLNPGKIVCNKCGLYERTHLRARPLRFDELRSGTKPRKPSKPSTSPKQSKLAMIKKEPREFGIDRRSSVSSGSSIHSSSGASDWDDNVSLYSSGSAPPTSFNSPIAHNYSLSRDDSLSPPRDGGGIRLPNSPLSDLASMCHPSNTTSLLSQAIPRKSQTSPVSYYPSPSLSEVPQLQNYYSHPQNAPPPEDVLWVEPAEMNNSVLVSSPTGSS